MRRATAALVLVAGLGLTGCSSSSSDSADSADDPSGATTAPTASSSPSETASETAGADTGSGDDIAAADIPGLALGADAFPAPYTFTKLPPSALKKSSDLVGGALSGATYDPAECGQAASATSDADLSKSGLALGADQETGNSVVEVVAPASTKIPDFDTLIDTCSTFSFSVASPTGAGGKVTGDATIKLLSAPTVSADRVQAAETTVVVSLGGQKQTVVTTIYVAELRGVVILINGTAASGSSVDTAVLDQLLTAGVAKVAAA